MTIVTASADYRAKGLTRTQKVSAFHLQSLTALDDVRVMHMIAVFIRYEFRPATIVELLGVPKKLVKRLYEREVIRPPTGRRPTAVGQYFASPQQHLEVSYLVEVFRPYYEIAGGHVTPWGVMSAYALYLEIAQEKTRIVGEGALAVIAAWDKKEIFLQPCSVCHTHFLRGKEELRIAWTHGFGGCPACRGRDAADATKTRVVERSERDSRMALEKTLRAGIRKAKDAQKARDPEPA